jgi:tryptophan synthase alpha chain
MSRLSRVFERSRDEKRPALIAFLAAGYPALELTPELIRAACEGGAEIIELGVPYSDPLADGPTIQAASQRALENGANLDWILAMAAQHKLDAPLLAFSYYNPLYVRGIAKTAADLAAAGFEGAIVPDLPPEEAQPLRQAFEEKALSLNFLVAPTTPLPRAREIAAACTDFVYVTSRMGVTGVHSDIDGGLAQRLVALRAVTKKPLAVGFGISRRDQVQALAGVADGIVVGTALVEASASRDGVAAVKELCETLRAPLVTR